jgi:hypothetical protein
MITSEPVVISVISSMRFGTQLGSEYNWSMFSVGEDLFNTGEIHLLLMK